MRGKWARGAFRGAASGSNTEPLGLEQSGAADDSTNPPTRKRYRDDSTPRGRKNNSLGARLSQLEYRMKTVEKRVDNNEREIKRLDSRFYNIEVFPTVELVDILSNVLTEGMGIDPEIAFMMIRNAQKIVRTPPRNCVLVTWASELDRNIVFQNKSQLANYENRWGSAKVSVTPNYTYHQNEITAQRWEVIKKLRQSGQYTTVKASGLDKIKVDGQDPVHFSTFAG